MTTWIWLGKRLSPSTNNQICSLYFQIYCVFYSRLMELFTPLYKISSLLLLLLKKHFKSDFSLYFFTVTNNIYIFKSSKQLLIQNLLLAESEHSLILSSQKLQSTWLLDSPTSLAFLQWWCPLLILFLLLFFLLLILLTQFHGLKHQI